MSSVQKILDELQHSRILLDKDTKAGERARLEYVEIEKKIHSLKDQYEFCSGKLRDIYKSSAVRTIEVSLYAKKIEILALKMDELKEKIHLHWIELKKVQLECCSQTEDLLQESMEFSQMWNCTEAGYEKRKSHHLESILELSHSKTQLLLDLEYFNAVKGQIDSLADELSEIEMKYERQEITTLAKETELFKELDQANDSLQNMLQQNEDKNRQRNNELNKISKNIEDCQGRIDKLQIQTSNYQMLVDDQKKSQPIWSMSDSQYVAQQKNRKVTAPNRYAPIFRNQIVNTQTAGINFNVKNLKREENQYSGPVIDTQIQQEDKTMPRKVFQFKKKTAATFVNNKETSDFVSGTTVFNNETI